MALEPSAVVVSGYLGYQPAVSFVRVSADGPGRFGRDKVTSVPASTSGAGSPRTIAPAATACPATPATVSRSIVGAGAGGSPRNTLVPVPRVTCIGQADAHAAAGRACYAVTGATIGGAVV